LMQGEKKLSVREGAQEKGKKGRALPAWGVKDNKRRKKGTPALERRHASSEKREENSVAKSLRKDGDYQTVRKRGGEKHQWSEGRERGKKRPFERLPGKEAVFLFDGFGGKKEKKKRKKGTLTKKERELSSRGRKRKGRFAKSLKGKEVEWLDHGGEKSPL